MIVSVRGHTPIVAADAFIAETATLIGQVEVAAQASIWFGAILRGDVEPIVIGRECNIQDGSVVHGTFKKCGTTLEERVSVGHLVTLHGTHIGRASLIGMGSILMDQSRIGAHCLVGAGSLVTEGSQFADGSLIFGRPAKRIRALTNQEIENLEANADNYLMYTKWYQKV